MIEPVESNFSIEGNGLPLFLVHGIGGAIDVWRFLIPKLSKIFTVISYDLRGHGKTSITKNKLEIVENQ